MSKLLLAIVVITVHILAAFIALNTFTEKKLANNVSSIPVNLLSLNKNQLTIKATSSNNHLINKKKTKSIADLNQNKADIITSNVTEDLSRIVSLVKKNGTELKTKSTAIKAQVTKSNLPEFTSIAKIKTAKIINIPQQDNRENESADKLRKIESEFTGYSDIAKSSVVKPNKRIAKYLYNPAPLYPRFARKRGYQGKVELNLLISQSGKVTDIKLLNSSGFKVLDKSAIKTVSQWLFVPTQLKDQAIDYWYQQNINFQLKTKGKVSNI